MHVVSRAPCRPDARLRTRPWARRRRHLGDTPQSPASRPLASVPRPDGHFRWPEAPLVVSARQARVAQRHERGRAATVEVEPPTAPSSSSSCWASPTVMPRLCPRWRPSTVTRSTSPSQPHPTNVRGVPVPDLLIPLVEISGAAVGQEHRVPADARRHRRAHDGLDDQVLLVRVARLPPGVGEVRHARRRRTPRRGVRSKSLASEADVEGAHGDLVRLGAIGLQGPRRVPAVGGATTPDHDGRTVLNPLGVRTSCS